MVAGPSKESHAMLTKELSLAEQNAVLRDRIRELSEENALAMLEIQRLRRRLRSGKESTNGQA